MNRKGFALIEILLAAALFVAVISTFSYLLKQAASTASSIDGLSRAIYTVRGQAEELRRIPFEDLPALNGGSFSMGSGEIHVLPLLPDLLTIQIDLKWDPKRPPLQIYTLRSKHG